MRGWPCRQDDVDRGPLAQPGFALPHRLRNVEASRGEPSNEMVALGALDGALRSSGRFDAWTRVAERQLEYVLQLIDRVLADGRHSVEAGQDATDAFNARLVDAVPSHDAHERLSRLARDEHFTLN